MKPTTFKDLIVWQKSMNLVKEIYIYTNQLPKEEIYGLSSQMRRCAISVPSNIAEGKHRSTQRDFKQFLHIALGSLAELETQLLIARDFYQEPSEVIFELIEETRKMLLVFINRLSA